jgi:hypothetical protein
MCGKNSQWLGPKRRKKEFGSEDAGTPRPSLSKDTTFNERPGFYNGVKIRRR